MLMSLVFVASTATEYNEVLLGDQPCKYGVSVHRFGDCFYFHHQGRCDEWHDCQLCLCRQLALGPLPRATLTTSTLPSGSLIALEDHCSLDVRNWVGEHSLGSLIWFRGSNPVPSEHFQMYHMNVYISVRNITVTYWDFYWHSRYLPVSLSHVQNER
jgi:hypothetical protein